MQQRRRNRVRIRITTRGRILLIALTAIIAVSIVNSPRVSQSSAASLSGNAASGYVEQNPGFDQAEHIEVIVRHRDTLWRIAERYGPQQVDPRRTIAAIMERNQLKSPVIQPGQRLLVPTRL